MPLHCGQSLPRFADYHAAQSQHCQDHRQTLSRTAQLKG